jgi:hypothetical protein
MYIYRGGKNRVRMRAFNLYAYIHACIIYKLNAQNFKYLYINILNIGHSHFSVIAYIYFKLRENLIILCIFFVLIYFKHGFCVRSLQI